MKASAFKHKPPNHRIMRVPAGDVLTIAKDGRSKLSYWLNLNGLLGELFIVGYVIVSHPDFCTNFELEEQPEGPMLGFIASASADGIYTIEVMITLNNGDRDYFYIDMVVTSAG
jgi:hypothetical protein